MCRVSGVEVDRILSRHAVSVATHRLAGIGIQIEAREIATGDIQANAVPGHEPVARRRQRDLDRIHLAGRQ